jgi:uncharacterized RDD family membrane protein YckC
MTAWPTRGLSPVDEIMAAITVLKENVPHGPFTRAEVAQKLAVGEITLDSLAFIEGLTQWTPLRDVLARVDAATVPVPTPPPVATMPIGSGYAVVTPPGGTPIGTGYSYAATMQPPSHLVYAGFWLRFAAVIVDGFVLLPLALVSVGLNYISSSSSNDSVKLVIALFALVYMLFCLIVQWLYFALQEASVHQATLGKRLLGLRVTDAQGNRIGFGRATGRYFGKILSGLIFYIGFMMAGWTPRKQALHDMLADTLVVRK